MGSPRWNMPWWRGFNVIVSKRKVSHALFIKSTGLSREINFGEDRLRQREADNVVAELRDEELEFQKKTVHCLPMIRDMVNLEVRLLNKT